MEKIKSFLQTKNFKVLLGIVAGLIVLLFVFQAGMFIGFRKASFSYRFGDNYYRNFGGERGMAGGEGNSMMGIPRGGFSESHGGIGKVISVILPTFVVQGVDGIEKIIRINDGTVIMKLRDRIDSKNIVVDDFVTVIGTPNTASEIEAKLIRIMPAPQVFTESTTTPKK